MFWPTCNVVIAKKKKLCRGWPSVWLSSPRRFFLIFCLPSRRRQSCFFLLYSLTTRQASSVSSCLHCFTRVPCTPLTVKHLRGARKRSQRIPAHWLSIPACRAPLCSLFGFSAFCHRSCNHTLRVSQASYCPIIQLDFTFGRDLI